MGSRGLAQSSHSLAHVGEWGAIKPNRSFTAICATFGITPNLLFWQPSLKIEAFPRRSDPPFPHLSTDYPRCDLPYTRCKRKGRVPNPASSPWVASPRSFGVHAVEPSKTLLRRRSVTPCHYCFASCGSRQQLTVDRRFLQLKAAAVHAGLMEPLGVSKMKIFLSWSGERSQRIAQTLRDSLPLLMSAAEPWLSESDIEKGARWNSVLAGILDSAKVGIFCLTPVNVSRPALLFESGAISKSVSEARVCVLLDGMEPKDVAWPWSQFQCTRLHERRDMYKMLTDINNWIAESHERALPKERFPDALEMWWPVFERELTSLPNDNGAPVPERPDREILIELLELQRGQQRALATMEEEWGRYRTRSEAPDALHPLLRVFAEALDKAGHHTAAILIKAGTMGMDRMGNCTVRVPARKTLTELVFSEEALRLMHKAGKEEDFRLGRLGKVCATRHYEAVTG